jgi:O-antigen ligase
VEMIRDHPFFGVGVANVKEVYPLYRLGDAPRFRIPHLHNNPVQIWAERGIFALMAYLWFVGAFVLACVRGSRSSERARLFGDAGLAAITALTLAGLFEYNFGDSEVLHVTLALVAFTLAGMEQGPASAGGASSGGDSAPAPRMLSGR